MEMDLVALITALSALGGSVVVPIVKDRRGSTKSAIDKLSGKLDELAENDKMMKRSLYALNLAKLRATRDEVIQTDDARRLDDLLVLFDALYITHHDLGGNGEADGYKFDVDNIRKKRIA
jgi:hypothetical protein